MKAARSVKPDIDKGITSQGFYVMNADGKAYGFNNNRSVERVTGFAQKGLEAFGADPAVTTKLAESEVVSNWHTELPLGGASVRVHARIRPVPAGADPANANVARDHLWIYPNEIAALQKDGKLPEAVAWRIARFHLVDNIRGEPDHWAVGDVKKADLILERVSDREWKLKGDFAMQTADNARGLEARLEGRIVLEGEYLKVFRAYGEGTAWGRSTYTPNPPEGKFPIVFAFDLTQDQWSRHVTPQAVFFGAEYVVPRR